MIIYLIDFLNPELKEETDSPFFILHKQKSILIY
jgi:hypothetical protein